MDEDIYIYIFLQAQKIRIKYEIKYLYKKKQQLNLQLYQIHLDNSKKWSQTRDIIEYDMLTKLKTEMREIYLFQNSKIKHLEEKNTNIQFTMEETIY
jgi:hypothetical protein